ncbi:hypothetical protein U9M48_000798 [Paspalum notatum var. saurae]|uniref:Uncharacterized protein n=1 Tax=Paspalum notatum var. saurae TaxID=547442 RepID=A0AAQ3SCJ8_PASNO
MRLHHPLPSAVLEDGSKEDRSHRLRHVEMLQIQSLCVVDVCYVAHLQALAVAEGTEHLYCILRLPHLDKEVLCSTIYQPDWSLQKVACY